MDTANFSQQLRVLPTLVKTLAEDNTHKFKISARGHLSVLRGTRWTTSKSPLDVDAVRSLAEAVVTQGDQALLGPWFLRVYSGVNGLTIFGERRLDLPDRPIDPQVHEQLLQLARAGSTGVVAGGLGSRKGSLLLWLASQLGQRELVIVSDIPPRQLPAPTATHVFPPSNDRQRRDLERLLRAHDCIFWDGVRHPDDMIAFVNAPNTHNRWFSVDADTPQALALRLQTLIAPVGNLRIDGCLFVDVDTTGNPEIASLTRHHRDGWTELLDESAGVVDALAPLDVLVWRPHPSRPAPTPADPAPKPAEPAVQNDGGEAASIYETDAKGPPKASPSQTSEAAIITPKRAGKSGPHRAAPPKARDRADEPTVNSDMRPLSEDDLAEATSEPEFSESQIRAATEQLEDVPEGMSLDELLQSDEIDQTELLRQSGEIDLQAFVRARNERMLRQQSEAAHADEPSEASASGSYKPSTKFDVPPPGVGLEQSSDDAVTNIANGEAVDAMLAQMEGADAPSFPDVDPDELTPPVRGETTALTPVDMEQIRESAQDDLDWLLGDQDDDPLGDQPAARAEDDEAEGTEPARSIWDADPAPTDELSAEQVRRERAERKDSD